MAPTPQPGTYFEGSNNGVFSTTSSFYELDAVINHIIDNSHRQDREVTLQVEDVNRLESALSEKRSALFEANERIVRLSVVVMCKNDIRNNQLKQDEINNKALDELIEKFQKAEEKVQKLEEAVGDLNLKLDQANKLIQVERTKSSQFLKENETLEIKLNSEREEHQQKIKDCENEFERKFYEEKIMRDQEIVSLNNEKEILNADRLRFTAFVHTLANQSGISCGGDVEVMSASFLENLSSALENFLKIRNDESVELTRKIELLTQLESQVVASNISNSLNTREAMLKSRKHASKLENANCHTSTFSRLSLNIPPPTFPEVSTNVGRHDPSLVTSPLHARVFENATVPSSSLSKRTPPHNIFIPKTTGVQNQRSNRHGAKRTERGNGTIICWCGRLYQNEESFKVHMRKVTEKWKHKCGTCKHGYFYLSDLNKHLLTSSKCGQTLRKLRQSFVRKKRHAPLVFTKGTALKFWWCSCGRKFTSKINRARHAQHFNNERKFNCQHCHRNFFFWGHLRRHMFRKHSTAEIQETQPNRHAPAQLDLFDSQDNSQRHHLCTCGKLYLSKSSLNRHIKTMKYGAIYGCLQCSRGFTQLDNLKGHMSRIHKKRYKGFKCGWCSKFFCFSTEFQIHCATFH